MAVIDDFSASNFFGEGGLNKRQVKVSLVPETFQKRRRLFQCSPEFLLRNSPHGRSLDNHIAVDAAVAETPSKACSEPFATAKRASGDGNDGHFIIVPGKRPAKRAQA